MKLSTEISIGFLMVISIDLLDSYVNYSLTQKVNTNTIFLTTSESIIRNSSDLNRSIIATQSAFRGFLLTGDQSFLSKYNYGLNSLQTGLNQEKKLVSSLLERRELDSINLLHNQWLRNANKLIKVKSEAIKDPRLNQHYRAVFDSEYRPNLGKHYNDRIAAIFQSFDSEEYAIRDRRRQALAASIKRTEKFSIIFSALTVVIGLSCAFYLVTKISRRINSMVQLASNISLGNFTQVDDHEKDELSSLSASLNLMSNALDDNIGELNKKNDELNQFAYVVSHNLKAPIRGIANVLQWIQEDLHAEISQNMQKYLEIIPERLKRMELLIDGLLEYARIGREKQSSEYVNVQKLITEISGITVPKHFELVTKNLPELQTEKLLLGQVFSNLIDNAVKYTKRQNGKITVSCIEETAVYEFTVSDNGEGIDSQYHDKVFEIFQTLREKNEQQNTGIGLAIVKKILEDKKCAIKIISSPGKGASFIFTWPKHNHEE